MEKIIIILLLLAALSVLPVVQQTIRSIFQRLRKAKSNGELFDNTYIEVRNFYLREFRTMPCVSFIQGIQVESAYEYITAGNAGKVEAVFQSNYYNWQDSKHQFQRTVFKLEHKVLIELGYDFAKILFDDNSYEYASALGEQFIRFRSPEKTADFEINIITINGNCLDLKQMPINKTELDLALYYNDDFIAIDEVIRKRLSQENDKGIILLHGLPGTGKTTYLRHLVGMLKKKVLFVSPAIAENLVNPEFVDLLLDHPNSVLIIEDAENLIMDRKFNTQSGVSNLLNISDGLLSDCLNVQIICTFNNALSTVDSALLRKGRLIAKYEFGKLSTKKAQALSDHLGFTNKISHPMTLAEISNPGPAHDDRSSVQVIGFRRETVMN